MRKVGWIGLISGAIAGGVGAILVSSYDFSIFVVAVIGALIRIIVSMISGKIR